MAFCLVACAGTPAPTPVPTATPVPESCSNRGAVPNPQANPGLVADCEVLLSARDILAGSGSLNWAVNLDVRDWDGITISESRNRVTGLGLTNNQLTGRIPPELSELPYLTELRLSGNQLTGGIPEELGWLPYLIELQLNGNQLTGEIPSDLGNLTRLTGLGLTDNQLTGEIPVELGNLTNLTELLLAGNQLTGRIPTELGELLNLRALSLGDNAFHGCVPEMLHNVGWSDLQETGLEYCPPLAKTVASSVVSLPTSPTIGKQAAFGESVTLNASRMQGPVGEPPLQGEVVLTFSSTATTNEIGTAGRASGAGVPATFFNAREGQYLVVYYTVKNNTQGGLQPSAHVNGSFKLVDDRGRTWEPANYYSHGFEVPYAVGIDTGIVDTRKFVEPGDTVMTAIGFDVPTDTNAVKLRSELLDLEVSLGE